MEPRKIVPVEMLTVSTGEVVDFPSFAQAARAVDILPTRVLHATRMEKEGRGSVVYGKWRFREKGQSNWGKVSKVVSVTLINVDTGEEQTFDSYVAAAKVAGCDADTVSARHRGILRTKRPIKGTWNVKPSRHKHVKKKATTTNQHLKDLCSIHKKKTIHLLIRA